MVATVPDVACDFPGCSHRLLELQVILFKLAFDFPGRPDARPGVVARQAGCRRVRSSVASGRSSGRATKANITPHASDSDHDLVGMMAAEMR